MTAADLVNLGLISFRTGEPRAALDFWRRAQAVEDRPIIDMNIGFALSHLVKYEEAMPHFERAWERRELETPDRQYPIRMAYGMGLLRVGRWLEAWQVYNPTVMFREFDTKIPPWDHGSLYGKEVLVTADGGFGDAIMFSRWLPEFKKLGAHVSYLNTPALVPLFYDNPYFAGVNQSEQRRFDCWISQFDIPRVFDVTPETVLWPGPYMRSDGRWRWDRENSKPHVGICWTSTEKATPQPWFRFRSLRDIEANRFFEYDRVQWVNLTYGKRGPDCIVDARLENWSDTANLIDSLDLVITTDTSILHLAGAMGKPTWAILGGFYDGKFLMGRDDTPWYPSLRLFRNGDLGFDESIAAALTSLDDWVNKGETECHEAMQSQAR